MKDAEIIRLAGGARALSEALSITLDAARKFQQRGIPWKYRPAVRRIVEARLGKIKKLKLPADFLETRK